MPLETSTHHAAGRTIEAVRHEVGTDPSRPWAVVFHEIWGLTPFVEASVLALGAAGYNAFAPSFTGAYGGERGYPYSDMTTPREIRSKFVDAEIDALVDAIAADIGVRPALALGYCWGGYAAAHYSAHHPQTRVLSFYGPGIGGLGDAIGKLEGQLHYARQDNFIKPEHVEAVRAKAGSGLEIFDDYEANHGFMCWERPVFDRPSMLRGTERAFGYATGLATR